MIYDDDFKADRMSAVVLALITVIGMVVEYLLHYWWMLVPLAGILVCCVWMWRNIRTLQAVRHYRRELRRATEHLEKM
jgi:hypothetical protein